MLTAFWPMHPLHWTPYPTLPFSIPQTVPSSLSSPSNHITGAKDHTSTQVDTASVKFHGQFKNLLFSGLFKGWVSHMILLFDWLRLLMAYLKELLTRGNQEYLPYKQNKTKHQNKPPKPGMVDFFTPWASSTSTT